MKHPLRMTAHPARLGIGSADHTFRWTRMMFGLSLLFADVARAHPVDAGADGFTHGLRHPFGGCDHLLAMVAVGLWAAQVGGRSLWATPCIFLSMMAVGGVLGISGVPMPAVEHGIIVSVVAIGTLIACGVRPPLLISGFVVGVFALCHGHAHGVEVHSAKAAWASMLGFLLATALLHATGVGMGVLLRSADQHAATRVTGAMVAISGIFLAFL